MKYLVPALQQCEELFDCTEEEKRYAIVMMSTVFSALITSVDLTDASSPIAEPLSRLVARASVQHTSFLTYSLLYALLYFTEPATLSSVVKNLSFLIT